MVRASVRPSPVPTSELGPEQQLLEAFPGGVVITDAAGTVLATNAAARATLASPGEALTLQFGALRAQSPEENDRLRAALAEMATRARVRAVILGTEERPQMPVILRPMVWRGEVGLAPAVAVCFPARRQDSGLECALLQDGYTMTGAESRVALLLLAGWSLGGIARELGVARSTVKSQAQMVYIKTGATGQMDLIRRLGPVLGPRALREP